MAEESRSVQCGQCKAFLDEPSGMSPEDRQPCPNCGSLGRQFNVGLTLSAKTHTSIGLKARREGQKKPYSEQFSGAALQRSTGRMVQKARLIDRDNDLYKERVIDPLTGEIILECEEPLSKHTKHGSARNNQRPKEGLQ